MLLLSLLLPLLLLPLLALPTPVVGVCDLAVEFLWADVGGRSTQALATTSEELHVDEGLSPSGVIRADVVASRDVPGVTVKRTVVTQHASAGCCSAASVGVCNHAG